MQVIKIIIFLNLYSLPETLLVGNVKCHLINFVNFSIILHLDYFLIGGTNRQLLTV